MGAEPYPTASGEPHDVTETTPSRKRKWQSGEDADDDFTKPSDDVKKTKRSKKVVDLTGDDDEDNSSPKKKGKKAKPKKGDEVRQRRYREKPPQSYWEIKDRALTQPMFVIDRVRAGTEDNPEEIIKMAGSTGNIYTVTIGHVPSCDCMHAKKGNQCKHIIFVLVKVLKAREGLQYQLAFLTQELRDIFSKAPPVPSEDNASANPGKRKSMEGDECCICMDPFEPQQKSVWCKVQCGTNFHEECFQRVVASKRPGEAVTCPFCRAHWQVEADAVKKVSQTGAKNSEGYVNVAAQLGLSGKRDYSTYHQIWYRTRRARGLIDDEA